MENKAYPYRGFMLDSARHFIPVDVVLRLIDAATRLGMNRLHWHLTDDQGWRLEIKRYPKLTQVGSVRGPSCFWGESETENNCGYYTQEDIRRVVAYARERGMEIVPEIEIPGHASAMLAAYPEYGCRRMDGQGITEKPYRYEVITYAGVFPNLICAGRDDAVQFLENILEEVTELFPGPEVHIGGDEAVKLHWRRCPDCQRRMREHGLKDENELQRWLVIRMGEFLKKRGKKTIVWNESLAGGMLPHHFIVQHWNFNDAETRAFMAEGGEVLCADADDYYICRPYYSLDARAVWQTPPVPAYAKGYEGQLIGYEAPLWGERITNPARAEYLLFPRLAIVAMRANGGDYPATWDACVDRLTKLRQELSPLALNWAPEETWALTEEQKAAGHAEEHRKRALPGMPRVFDICDRILRQEALEKLLKQIRMPDDFARQVADISLSEIPEFHDGVQADRSRGAGELSDQLLQALANRDSGPWRGKSEAVWLATLSCFTRFVNEHKKQYDYAGFDRAFWTVRQVGARLFRLGELEYELMEENGEKYLALHVPSDARLEADRLNASVANARSFMAEYYPEWKDAPITLTSWLLSQELAPYLPEDGRLIRFRCAFDIKPMQEDCLEAVLEWAFDMPREKRTAASIASLPENTRLQRSIKACLLAGDRPHEARGVLVRAFE